MKDQLLCALNDIPEPGSKAFAIEGERGAEEIFLVRKEGLLTAYRNQCPHTGGPLDWVPDQFLDLDKRYIQCATHDARFRLEDGFCVAGPCAGQSLQPVRLRVAAGKVWLVADQGAG